MSTIHDPAHLNYIIQGIRKGQRIGTVGGAVLGGALGGLPKTNHEGKTRTPSQRILHGSINALGLGFSGRGIGGLTGGLRNAQKWNKGYRPSIKKPDWLKNAKNRAEGRRAYYSQARKVHPDLHGGSEDEIKTLNKEWETHEPFFKEALLKAFATELEKLAGFGGALAGGIIGYHLPGGGKNKMINTVVGAGLGHMTGELGGIAKKKIIDDPHQRELQELYGYQPSVQGTGQGTNYY